MLSRRIFTRRLAQVATRNPTPRVAFSHVRTLRAEAQEQPDEDVNPPRMKRQFRDPYGGWWDKQERRNFGEPVHEDNDILAMFSPERHTHVSDGKGLFHLGCFIATVLGLCGVVKMYYPDKPAAPRTFPGGLEKELGGEGAVRAPKEGEDKW